VVPVLSRFLEDRDPALRRLAVTALANVGEGARPAVPNLIKLLEDKDLHDPAAEALVKIGRGAVPDLVAALDDHDFRRRLEVIVLLGKIGPEARQALGPLSVIASKDQYPRVRRAADDALKKIQGEQGAAAP
jgi:HEAT repeat protein